MDGWATTGQPNKHARKGNDIDQGAPNNTPFLHVPDLEAALSFFCDTLTFEERYRESNYAYIELGGCGLRLLEEPTRVLTPDGKSRVSVYIDVSDVDEHHRRLHKALEKLPSDRVEPLMNKSWKQREFWVRLPDGDWLTFGQPAPTDPH